jgi:TonB family protein
MFTSLHPESRVKQPVAFIASLSLQLAVLAALCCIPSAQGYGPSLRSGVAHSSSVTPIYFQKETIAAAGAPESAQEALQPAAALPSEAKPGTVQEADAQAKGTDEGSAAGEGEGLAPFPSWRMNSQPSGFTFMHHQVKNALPVFTPDPPILHRGAPEAARGKDIVMEVVIGDQGSITQVEVLQGAGYEVDISIVETLRRWIFVPAKINGVAIGSRQQVRFHFPG